MALAWKRWRATAVVLLSATFAPLATLGGEASVKGESERGKRGKGNGACHGRLARPCGLLARAATCLLFHEKHGWTSQPCSSQGSREDTVGRADRGTTRSNLLDGKIARAAARDSNWWTGLSVAFSF